MFKAAINVFISTLLLVITTGVYAQDRFPLAPPDTSSPKATFDSFHQLVDAANNQLAQLPNLPSEQQEGARRHGWWRQQEGEGQEGQARQGICSQ